MSSFAGPEASENGLIFCIDAANTKSYSGSGTTWTDSVGSGYSGTLTNGPTFSSNNGGWFTFDGADDYADFGAVANLKTASCSFEVWINAKSNTGYGDAAVVFDITDGTNWRNGAGLAVYGGNMIMGVGNGTTTYSASFAMPTGKWTHVVGTYDSGTGTIKLYLDGSLKTTTTGASQAYNVTNKLFIGWGGPGYTSYMSMRFATGKIYNRALTDTEVLLNYNSEKGRYSRPNIITNGLILNLDAGNTSSYSGSGTTWTDLSPKAYTATLSNCTFSSNSGGGIVFNGSTSYADLNTTSLIAGTMPFTIECMVTTTGNTASAVLGNYSNSYATNTLWFSVRYGLWINGSVPYFPGAPLALGNYIVGVTRDASGNTKLYQNGNLVASSTSTTSISSNQNWRIGQDVSPGGEQLTGTIYTLKAYDTALSSDQMWQNFNAQRDRLGL